MGHLVSAQLRLSGPAALAPPLGLVEAIRREGPAPRPNSDYCYACTADFDHSATGRFRGVVEVKNLYAAPLFAPFSGLRRQWPVYCRWDAVGGVLVGLSMPSRVSSGVVGTR